MKARSKTAFWLAALALVIAMFGGRHTRQADHVSAQRRSAGSSAMTTSATVKSPMLPPIVAGGLRFEGQVVDLQDQPIGGAKVTLAGQRVVTSEADGSFAFDGVAEATYVVTAEVGDAYGEDSAATLTDTSDPVTIRVRRGAALRVRVIATESGAAIAGAVVNASDREALTDATGLAVLRALDAGYERVRITAAGRASQRFTVTSEDPLATLERTVELAVGANVGGVVVDQDGKPVAGASVRVNAAGETWSDVTYSDDAGKWSIPAFGPGKHGVQASSQSHVAQPDLVFEHDGVTARTDLVVRVVLGAEIAGIVVDDAGRPVAGARVVTNNGAEDTDANGRFVVPGADDGPQEVYAVTQLGISPTTKLEIAGRRRVEVKLVMIRSSLAGIVVDSHGQPIENAIVAARHDGHVRYTPSDERGAFDFGGVMPGDYEVTAQRGVEIHRALPPGFTVKSGDRGVRIALPDLGSISGRVLLGGKPVPFYGFVVADDPTSIDRPTAVRESRGAFEQTDLAPGTWHVILAGPGFTRHVVKNIELVAGQHLDLGDITVSGGRTLAGRVVDERGAPVAGATVGVFANRFDPEDGVLRLGVEGTATALTDPAGRFQISGIGEKATLVQVSHPTLGVTPHRALAVHETSIELVLAGVGGIDGIVDNSNRDSNVIATLATDDDQSFRASVDAAGSFRFDRMPPGTYRVRLYGGVRIGPQHVVVHAGQRTPVTFELPAQLITLAVRAPGCDHMTLFAVNADDSTDVLDQETCVDGVARFRKLVTGRHALCADGTCKHVEIAPGAIQAVDFY